MSGESNEIPASVTLEQRYPFDYELINALIVVPVEASTGYIILWVGVVHCMEITRSTEASCGPENCIFASFSVETMP